MAAPLERTAQGHELHFEGTISDTFCSPTLSRQMLRESKGRLVSVSSSLSMIGELALDLDDLDWNARKYDPWYAYRASKAENVLFADEFAFAGRAQWNRGEQLTPRHREQAWCVIPRLAWFRRSAIWKRAREFRRRAAQGVV